MHVRTLALALSVVASLVGLASRVDATEPSTEPDLGIETGPDTPKNA